MRSLWVPIGTLLLVALLLVIQPAHAADRLSGQQPSSDQGLRTGNVERNPALAVPLVRDGVKNLRYVSQVDISTPSHPVGIASRETKLVPYRLKEKGNVSGKITARTYQFFTQYDIPLSEEMGPFKTGIPVRSQQETDWNELVYLPESVAEKAASMDEYAIVLKTTFKGKSSSGAGFAARTSLLLLLPPKSFSKDIPENQAADQSTSPTLQWDASLGAVDYEYCFDTVDNNSCDTHWTGTYWLTTGDTNAALQNLPSGTTFYWQVRANNTAGTTYANDSTWWSFTTACSTNLVAVENVNDSGAGSLRQAIADVCPGGTIEFDPSLSGQTITLSSTLFLYKGVKIDGSQLESKISVSGNNTTAVFEIASNIEVTLSDLMITNGRAVEEDGVIFSGGINNFGTLQILNSVISNNGSELSAEGNGGGIYNSGGGILRISGSTISDNTAHLGGGILNFGDLQISSSTISDNTGMDGGGITSYATLELSNSTVSNNTAEGGGGILNRGTAVITNSTFVENNASGIGGGLYGAAGSLTLTNVTFSDNESITGGVGIHNSGTLNLINSILANSTLGSDCYNDNSTGTIGVNLRNLIEVNAAAPNGCGTPFSTADPNLGPLANNGGLTQTLALRDGSPAIDAGNALNCPDTDQRGLDRPQGNRCDLGAYEVEAIQVTLGSIEKGPYVLGLDGSRREKYQDVNTGPVVITTSLTEFIASQRVIYGEVSYSEMMGLPAGQLSKEYLFPYYNNVAMDSQLRVSNLGSVPTTINVYLGSDLLDSYELGAGLAVRKSYPNANSGPLRVVSTDADILTTIRVLYGGRSYSELMGFPVEALSQEYWYPVYDNVNLSGQLRVSNVGDGPTTITVYLAGNPVPIDSYELPAGAAARKNYPQANGGPLQVVSSAEPVLTTIRQLYKDKSYAELPGLPVEQISREFVYPVYNNLGIKSQLRVANAGAAGTTINIYAAGELIDSFPLGAGDVLKRSYPQNTGPLRVVSSAEPIVSSVRQLYDTPTFSSFYELMGLPEGLLSTQYFFPWYNNSAMKSELRLAVP